MAGERDAIDRRLADYRNYPGQWRARPVWNPARPGDVVVSRRGGFLILSGTAGASGVWDAEVSLTDADGVSLRSRNPDGAWNPVSADCELRAVDFGGASPISAAPGPAEALGPFCSAPGTTWEARVRRAGETAPPEAIWAGFTPPAITDPGRLIWWYPYQTTLRGDWLAPWEKPLPAGSENYYPASGEFNDPYRNSGGIGWDGARYRWLMREAWEAYFPEYPLTP